MYKPKKKAPKKILMKKKYSMALTNITSLLYKVHKTHTQYYITITYVLDYCTNINYQEHITAAKMLRKKNIKGWQIIRRRKKNQYRQLKPYIWCQLISSNSLIWNKEWYTIHHTFILSYLFYRNRMIFKQRYISYFG